MRSFLTGNGLLPLRGVLGETIREIVHPSNENRSRISDKKRQALTLLVFDRRTSVAKGRRLAVQGPGMDVAATPAGRGPCDRITNQEEKGSDK